MSDEVKACQKLTDSSQKFGGLLAALSQESTT
jgi:hypothetical protein